jgi:hypothetical protein
MAIIKAAALEDDKINFSPTPCTVGWVDFFDFGTSTGVWWRFLHIMKKYGK